MSMQADCSRWSTRWADPLAKVQVENPGYSISVTGLAAIAARNSANMIEKLNRGLTFEFVFVAAFIGAAFRSSFVVMLVAILPGIFPVVASGALLSVTGQGLQFASVVALIVSFGLGLSATIHFLNRLRLEDRPGARIQASRRTGDRPRWPSLDSDVGSARLRIGGDGVFRPAVASLIRLAERIRHDRGADRRSLYPAPDGYGFAKTRRSV